MPDTALTRKQQELVEEIRRVAGELGRTPTLAELDQNPDWPTVGRIKYHFGNYTNLLVAAELVPARCTKRYKVKEMTRKLTAYIRALGRVPTQTEVRNDPTMPAGETYINVYGDWEAAVAAAGFAMNWCAPWMREKLIRDLQRKYRELGYRLPSPQDIQGDPAMEKIWVYVQVFGSMKYAQRTAGIYDDFCRRQRKEIIETLRRLHKELGRTPTVHDEGVPNNKLIKKVFGSFNAALKAAGLEINRQSYSREVLIGQLRKKWAELGRSPTAREIDIDPEMASIQTFRRFFGSHAKALRAAELPPTPKGHGHTYTREELISQLRKKTRELGRPPTTREINEDPEMASASVFQRMFGSYKLALEAAGVRLARLHPKHTREELIRQLRMKTAELGRVPTQKEIEDDPKMAAANTFTREFGSLNAAIVAAGLKPRNKREYTDEELLDDLERKYDELDFVRTGRRPTNKEINADPKMASTRAYDVHFGKTSRARAMIEERIRRRNWRMANWALASSCS